MSCGPLVLRGGGDMFETVANLRLHAPSRDEEGKARKGGGEGGGAKMRRNEVDEDEEMNKEANNKTANQTHRHRGETTHAAAPARKQHQATDALL